MLLSFFFVWFSVALTSRLPGVTAWDYLDFTSYGDYMHMYGVLECCMYSNITASSKLLGSYHDYLVPPTNPYRDYLHDLAMHMGMTPCVAQPNDLEDAVAMSG